MTRWSRVAFGLALVVTLMAAITVTARAFGAATERDTRYRYLEDALERRPESHRAHVWKAAARPLVRPLGQGDRDSLETRLGEAWAAFGVAQETGETDHLADWFGGAALERAQRAAATAFADGTRMVVLRQTLQPEFQHLDGSMVQLRSETLALRYGPDHYALSRDATRTTLLRRSTGWHLVAHERDDAQPAETPVRARPLPGKLAGLNYYPALTPWRAFWPNYDPVVIGEDFDRVAQLGGNALRIFLPVDDFRPGPDLGRNLANLADLLAQAERRGLHVIPTLFDLKDSYALAGWTEDLAQLDLVLPVLAAAPAVALIDIKNEPDLDFGPHGRQHVLAWLRTMASEIRHAAPDLPLTVGWAHADAGHLLVPQLDVISYHDYAPVDGTRARLDAVRAAAGGRPVLVTEIGVSAWSLLGGVPSSDAAQREALGARLDALATADGVLIWTLHDFPDPDSRAVGSSFWVRGLQARFGVLDETGAPRPVAARVRAAFDTMLKGDR